LKSRIFITGVIALIMFVFYMTPDSTRAYYPKYAQPQQTTSKPKTFKPEPLFIPIKEVRGYATGYFGPREEDYTTREKYLKAVRMNGEGKVTKSGTPPHIGTIAADTDFYPFGTVLYFPEINFLGTVEDIGSKVKGEKHVDIFCGHGKAAEKIAKKWGAGTPITFRVLKLKKVVGG